jgi:hypothetical protein
MMKGVLVVIAGCRWLDVGWEAVDAECSVN